MLHNVSNDHTKMAFALYGNIIEVSREKWRVDDCASFSTLTSTVVLRIKVGVTPDDLLHQLHAQTSLLSSRCPEDLPCVLGVSRRAHTPRVSCAEVYCMSPFWSYWRELPDIRADAGSKNEKRTAASGCISS